LLPRTRQPVSSISDDRGGADVVCKPRLRLFQRRACALHDRIDRASRKPAAEQLAPQLDRVAARDTVSDREGGGGRLQAATEGTQANIGWQLGPRLGGTGRAAQPVETILAPLTAIGGRSETWWRCGTATSMRSSSPKRRAQA